jgi:hypothetical protein
MQPSPANRINTMRRHVRDEIARWSRVVKSSAMKTD